MQGITQTLGQQCPVDRFGDEIGGAGIERQSHRDHIVQTGQVRG